MDPETMHRSIDELKQIAQYYRNRGDAAKSDEILNLISRMQAGLVSGNLFTMSDYRAEDKREA